MKRILVFVLFSLMGGTHAWAEGYQTALQNYRAEAGQPLSAERGKLLWNKKVYGKSCTKCHNEDITQPGHKSFLFFDFELAPMALSANAKLFDDPQEADKEFDKRCKKVFGRVCTAQEKGDILKYLVSQ